MKPKTAEQMLKEVQAEEQLLARGYKKIPCSVCQGKLLIDQYGGIRECPVCYGESEWVPPEKKN